MLQDIYCIQDSIKKFLYDLGYLNHDEYSKKLINQGMILGNSAFIYRISGSNEYISSNLISNTKVDKVRIDIKYVKDDNQVDYNLLKLEDADFKNSTFKLKTIFSTVLGNKKKCQSLSLMLLIQMKFVINMELTP